MDFENENKGFKRKIGFTEGLILEGNTSCITIFEVLGHDFNRNLLKKAIHSAINSQPNLRINADFLDYSWVEVDNPYIEPSYHESDNQENWRIKAQEFMDVGFEYGDKNTLFKFDVLRIVNKTNKDLLKTFIYINLDHAISDGYSGKILFHQIITFYCILFNEEDNKFFEVEFLPAAEKLMFPSDFTDEELRKIQNIKNKFEENDDKLQVKVSPFKIEERERIKNYFFTAEGTEENFKKIKDFCKKNNFTLGTIFITAVYFEIGRYSIDSFKNDDLIDLSFNVDVNLRDRFEKKLGLHHVAMLISIIKLDLVFSKNIKFLELCKLVSERLNYSLKEKMYFYEVEANRLIYEKYLSSKERGVDENFKVPSMSSNLNLSNIGDYPFNRKYKLNNGEEIILRSMKCCGAPWAPNFAEYIFLIQTVTFMNYTFVHYNDLNHDYAEEFFKNLIFLSENSYNLENLSLQDYILKISSKENIINS